MFFDSHVHFDEYEGQYGIDSIVTRATHAQVDQIIAVGGSPEANRLAVEAAVRFPDMIKAAIGYDRDQANAFSKTSREKTYSIAQLKSEIKSLSTQGVHVAAVGETGLDFHYSPDTAKAQIHLFREQLALARELRLPVIVHSRNAQEATVSELRDHCKAWPGQADRIGVLHCFTGTAEFARRIADMGLYISFSGIITFRNASEIREAARIVPEHRLLIETDSPFLAPVPHRGKRNEPAYVRNVAEALAVTCGYSVDEIAKLTTTNAERLFTQHAGHS